VIPERGGGPRAATVMRSRQVVWGMVSTLLAISLITSTTGCDTDPLRAHEQITRLQSQDVNARIDAADALGRILAIDPNHPDAVQALIRALDDSVPIVQSTASGGLSSAAIRSRNARPALIQTLQDSLHPRARAAAAQVLGRLGGSATADVIAALAASLRDPNRDVRLSAVEALQRIRGKP